MKIYWSARPERVRFTFIHFAGKQLIIAPVHATADFSVDILEGFYGRIAVTDRA